MSDCIFCRIANGEIPADMIHHDEQVVVFRDLNPQAPVHLLAVPRKHIATLHALTDDDTEVADRLFRAAHIAAEKTGIADTGYRVVMNTGADAGQVVMHIHLHVLGGRTFSWPPG